MTATPLELLEGWLSALFDTGDAPQVWEPMAPNMRLALSQVIYHPAGRVSKGFSDAARELAEDIANKGPEHDGWAEFSPKLLRALRESYEPFRQPEHRYYTRSRPESVDLELILVTPNASGEDWWQPGEAIIAAPFLFKWSDTGWLLTGFGHRPASPGWPPDFHRGAVEWR